MNKTVRIISLVVLGISIVFLSVACVLSVITPIHFENTRNDREVAVVKNLSALRVIEREFCLQNGRYTADLDSLILFVKTGSKKEISKQGSLNEKQLSDGWTDEKVIKAMKKAEKTGKWKELDEAGISRDFRRDTIETPLITALFKGEYTEENIGEIIYIPYTDNVRFNAEVNDNYSTSQGIHVPLIMVSAHFDTYLADQDDQERINITDTETKLGHFPGRCFGSIDEPNNLAGNWE